jgi:hypothetical protein
MTEAEDNYDWEQTLQKMANLDELSTLASTGAKMLTDKRNRIGDTVKNMLVSVKLIKQKIDSIKSEGNTAKKACKDLIKNKYGPLQQQNIEKIMEHINTMTNMGELEKHILDLNADVGRMKKMTESSGIANDPTDVRRNIATQAAQAAATRPEQSGGYTYGKSKRKGKGRRKRNKKSRKKGSNKK